MIINRHNYEEFFLLYVDNELSDAERLSVEQFLEQNPDLAAELEMLKQATLPPEELTFEHKEALYNTAETIRLDNYESYFVLALDGELTKQEEEKVEIFILQHPELQNEFALLKQSRLEPESIVFEGKEKLYRKEQKEKPVILINWLRMSMAAAVVGLIAFTWFFTSQSNNSGQLPVANNNQQVKAAPEVVKPVIPEKQQAPQAMLAATKQPEVKNQAVKAEKLQRIADFKRRENKEVFAAVENKKPALQEAITTVPVDKAIEKQLQDKKKFEEAIASARINNNSNQGVVKEANSDTKFANTTSDNQGSLATQTVYRVIDTETNEEENTLYIGSAGINKTKLKGLFKKAASLIGKRTVNEDGEKTLRIAGFEIKSK